MAVVHVAVTRRVRPGCEAQFDEILMRFVRDSIGARGITGVHILRPTPGSEDCEYGVLRSFDSEEAAQQFYTSEQFARWLREASPLVDGEPVFRRLTGLECFFRSGQGPLPPRWKMAVVTFLGVFPTAMAWSQGLAPLLEGKPMLVRAMTINAAVVASLTWVVMPLLTKVFRQWLQQETAGDTTLRR